MQMKKDDNIPENEHKYPTSWKPSKLSSASSFHIPINYLTVIPSAYNNNVHWLLVLVHFVTKTEMWIHHYTCETKQHAKERVGKGESMKTGLVLRKEAR